MNIEDFWCRAFLAAMGGEYVNTTGDTRWENHGSPAAYCERAADVALEVAQRRGMIAGALPGDDLPADPPRPAPTLERVEFTAERDGDAWTIRVAGAGRFIAAEGTEVSCRVGGPVIHIKWGESLPSKPIEVWLERPSAISPASPGMSDAEVAAEFYRRFGPDRVVLGDLATGTAFAEECADEWRSGCRGAITEKHPAGEPGFVAAVLRARELVRKGGGA